MERYFNTTGPCNPVYHYTLPPERRIATLPGLVKQHLYFVLHAPRQVGKTTSMVAFAETLRGRGYRALYASLETARGFSDVERAEPLWVEAIAQAARIRLPMEQRPPPISAFLGGTPGSRLGTWLLEWSLSAGSPLVLLLDEVDVLEEQALLSFLAQLRAGFTNRPAAFPSSVGLIGMRDLRDYLVQAKGGVPVNPGSPFNIKAESLTLRNFNAEEVAELYGQHTTETGQSFTHEAIERAFYWTQGQPFLVNALARKAVMELCPAGETVTAAHIDAAREMLILSRTTHLDNLSWRLKEERVARIVRAVLLGDTRMAWSSDDFQYCLDLGLLREVYGRVEAANPIYREVLVRELAWESQKQTPSPWWPWLTPAGKLDFPALIDAFLGWWPKHGDLLVSGTEELWREVAAHLIFLAFLQRVVNGGGQTHREYASGRGRMDVLVTYAQERFVVELKRVPPAHVSLETIKAEGRQQLAGYLASERLTEGWLLVFDQRPGLSWAERMWAEDLVVEGRMLHLRGG